MKDSENRQETYFEIQKDNKWDNWKDLAVCGLRGQKLFLVWQNNDFDGGPGHTLEIKSFKEVYSNQGKTPPLRGYNEAPPLSETAIKHAELQTQESSLLK